MGPIERKLEIDSEIHNRDGEGRNDIARRTRNSRGRFFPPDTQVQGNLRSKVDDAAE